MLTSSATTKTQKIQLFRFFDKTTLEGPYKFPLLGGPHSVLLSRATNAYDHVAKENAKAMGASNNAKVVVAAKSCATKKALKNKEKGAAVFQKAQVSLKSKKTKRTISQSVGWLSVRWLSPHLLSAWVYALCGLHMQLWCVPACWRVLTRLCCGALSAIAVW